MAHRNNIITAGAIVLLLLFCSCGRKTLNAEAYAAWFNAEKENLQSEKEVGDYIFSLQYQPADYLLLLDQRNGLLPDSELTARRNELAAGQHFTLRIRSKNEGGDFLKNTSSNAAAFNENVNYFAFRMQEQLKLVDSGDTLPCSLFHFERSYGLSPGVTFLLSFPDNGNPEKEGDKILVYDDEALGLGKVMLTLDGKRLADIPLLTSN